MTNLLAALPMTGSFEGERLAVPRADGKGWELTQLTATLVSIALCDVRLALTLTLTLTLALILTLALTLGLKLLATAWPYFLLTMA